MVNALEQMVASPGAYAFAFVLGALLGSFANVCILRIPAGKSIVRPGSHCFACGAPVAWYDNLPILSYLILRGKCRRCGAKFSPRYLFVEAATGLLVAGVWWLAVVRPDEMIPHRMERFGIYAFFVLILVILAMIDLDTKLIPNVITYPAIPVFLGFGLLLGDVPWKECLIGCAAGYLVIRLLSDGYYFLFKREGLGYGDGKLLAIVGGLLGWRAVVASLFLGSMLGTVLMVPILVAKGREKIRHIEVPFGPFLVGGTLVYLFLQDELRVAFGLLTR